MLKHICLTATIFVSIGVICPVQAQKNKQGSPSAVKTDVKFLEDITAEIEPAPATTSSDPKAVFSNVQFTSKKTETVNPGLSIEQATSLQFNYALLLDVEVEAVKNLNLFKTIDDWFGTRYKMGGNTKNGIDCSGLMKIFFSSLYQQEIPRTCREQFAFAKKISRGELREGDLVFFNTTGGISHVGMYLQNNKFVHASSGGVMISDLYDDYWVHRFAGAGRVQNTSAQTETMANL